MKEILPRGEGNQRAVITHYTNDLEGNLIEQWNEKSLLDTRVITAEFPDKEAIEIYANTAVNSILHNCDADGNKFMLFKSIMDHKSTYKDVNNRDGYINPKNRAPERMKTTNG